MLSVIESEVQARGWSGIPVDFVLASELVHLALLPDVPSSLSAGQMQALAQGAFERILGESAPRWALRYCAIDSQSLLVAAIEQDLLQGLSGLANAMKGRLLSVTPAWACMLAHQRKPLSRATGWLVTVEEGSLVVCLLKAGRPLRIRSILLDNSVDQAGDQMSATARSARSAGQLERLLERESRLAGSEDRDVFLADPADSALVGPAAPWTVHKLQWPARLAGFPAPCRTAALAGI